jgi:glycosyltransferase involved in cell wall biosynthesis
MSVQDGNSKLTPSGQAPGVSVVLPILNEEHFLKSAVEAILAQEYPGALEVILALGPSTDRTDEIAAELAGADGRVVLVDNPTGRTAAALNRAIAQSRYSIICRIDGHAEIASTYIAIAVQTLLKTGAVNVGGIMAAVGRNPFERSVATAMRSTLGVGVARFHVGGKAGPADTVYLGVFDKAALLAVGGYDERFTRAQDWELNFRLRQAGGVIWFDPELVVTYRPRPNLRALTKQYFEYGRWRRAVIRNHKGTINFRYLAPPVTVVITLLSLALGATVNTVFFLPAALYLLGDLVGAFVIGKNLEEKIMLPTILLTMHFSWGIGFLTSPKDLL